MAKINQEWRTILRNIKCVELRNEAKNVQTYFADAFERKNQKIERLLAEIDQQEEMYVELYKSHMESINKFIGNVFDHFIHLIFILGLNFYFSNRKSIHFSFQIYMVSVWLIGQLNMRMRKKFYSINTKKKLKVTKSESFVPIKSWSVFITRCKVNTTNNRRSMKNSIRKKLMISKARYAPFPHSDCVRISLFDINR